MSAPGGVDLVEVFSSIQGEGPHVGRSTLFVRLGGCDLRCRWCDSPHTWKVAAGARLETAAGSRRFREVTNPVPLADVLAAAEALDPAGHAMVSLTGGEPLLQPDAVAALAAGLRGRGPRILLETHGLAHAALAAVVAQVDVVSMDWKLRSDVQRADEPAGTAAPDFHEEHARFLSVAVRAPEVVVKVVVTPHSRDAELRELVERVAALAPRACLVLQPVTPRGAVSSAPEAERMQTLHARASRLHADVRVIPQTHPLLGVL